MLEFPMENDQNAIITATPTTIKGKPAKLDGPLTGLIQEGTGEVRVGEKPNSIVYSPADDFTGDVRIKVSGDADLGEGVRPISDLVLIHVTGPEATNLGLTNTVEDK